MKNFRIALITYMTIWSLWLIYGLSVNYKEILTQAGIKSWTKQGFEELCLMPKLKNTIDCLYPTGDYVTEFSAAFHTWAFLQIFVIAPLVILIVAAFIFYSARTILVLLKRKNCSE